MFDTVVVILPPPAIVSVSVPIVTTSSEPESAPIVRLPATVAVEAAVSLPSASTVIIGTAEADPYEPADTEVADDGEKGLDLQPWEGLLAAVVSPVAAEACGNDCE